MKPDKNHGFVDTTFTKSRSGQFPFPITDGPDQSPYLAWIRHHSNYMATGGAVDYLRSVGVLVRGILINLLILTPLLLVLSIGLTFAYPSMLDHPYVLSRLAVFCWLGWVFLFPVVCSLFNIFGYQRTLKFGSSSSVKIRDEYERTFGYWLLVILALVTFESFPHVLTWFHDWQAAHRLPIEPQGTGGIPVTSGTLSVLNLNDSTALFPWLGGVSLGSIVALAAASHKLLTALGGLKRKFAITVLALLGLLVPATATLIVTDYLIYGKPPAQHLLTGMVYLIVLGVLIVIAALALGIWRQTFTWKETKAGMVILGTLLALNFAGAWLIDFAYETAEREQVQKQDQSIASSKRLLSLVRESEPVPVPASASASNSEIPTEVSTDEHAVVSDQTRDALATLREWLQLQRSTENDDVRQALASLENLVKIEREAPFIKAKFLSWQRADDKLSDAARALGAQSRSASRSEENTASTMAILRERNKIIAKQNEEIKQLADLAKKLNLLLFGAEVAYNYPVSSLANTNNTKIQPAVLRNRILTDIDIDNFDAKVAAGIEAQEQNFLVRLDALKAKSPDLVDEMRYFLKNPDLPQNSEIKPENNLYDSLDSREIRREIERRSNEHYWWVRALSVLVLATVLWVFCWFAVDVNYTSIHALYRDRLASTFLIGVDTKGDIGIEHDVDLEHICSYAAGSTAPYHLVNAAINLQGSRDVGVRDRKCGFFIFSKRFVGCKRTGYCRSEILEQVFPQMSLATAMAISAAAASPNMGRSTNSALVALMTMLNIRLGYWIPHPGRVEERRYSAQWDQNSRAENPPRRVPGFNFEEVFEVELSEIEQRWEQAYDVPVERDLLIATRKPAVEHNLVGLALSGGGIRSAAINLGITQALERRGVFRHVDYLSTVSGGGYLGASISTIMRTRTRRTSEIGGEVSISEGDDGQKIVTVRSTQSAQQRRYVYSRFAELEVAQGDTVAANAQLINRGGPRKRAAIDGCVQLGQTDTGEPLLSIIPTGSGDASQYSVQLSRFDKVAVKSGDVVSKGDALTVRHDTFADRFRWRVRPVSLLKEVFSKLDAQSRWVNLSDGGHIENLAAYELLRRRCRFIIVGDGEADGSLQFAGLATLIRTARIDLGVEITIDLHDIAADATGFSRAHWSLGRICYPNETQVGYLLYLKSSVTGKEDAAIREYRHRSPSFPHESTANQFFVEDQFEAYRALGQHIAEATLQHIPRDKLHGSGDRTDPSVSDSEAMPSTINSFSEFQTWFDALKHACRNRGADVTDHEPQQSVRIQDRGSGAEPSGNRVSTNDEERRQGSVEKAGEFDIDTAPS